MAIKLKDTRKGVFYYTELIKIKKALTKYYNCSMVNLLLFYYMFTLDTSQLDYAS